MATLSCTSSFFPTGSSPTCEALDALPTAAMINQQTLPSDLYGTPAISQLPPGKWGLSPTTHQGNPNLIRVDVHIWTNDRTGCIVDSLSHHVLPEQAFLLLKDLYEAQEVTVTEH